MEIDFALVLWATKSVSMACRLYCGRTPWIRFRILCNKEPMQKCMKCRFQNAVKFTIPKASCTVHRQGSKVLHDHLILLCNPFHFIGSLQVTETENKNLL